MDEVLNSSSPSQAAIRYAQAQGLPIGSKLEIRDVDDTPHYFVVERSSRSTGMLDGGGVRVRRVPPPLRGGAAEEGEEDKAGEAAFSIHGKDHILHARTMPQAALLFAKEANLPPGAYVSVENTDGTKNYFRTPQ